jgi:hypothetical protein
MSFNFAVKGRRQLLYVGIMTARSISFLVKGSLYFCIPLHSVTRPNPAPLSRGQVVRVELGAHQWEPAACNAHGTPL